MISGGSALSGETVMHLMLKLWIITEEAMMATRDIPPIHPGEILLEEFLKPMGISQYALAKAIKVPPRRINEIVQGKRAITADTALRLARFFGTDAQSWLNLQTRYDLEMAEMTLGSRLVQEIQPRVA
jgi:addiction module HigA family antidote